MPDKPNLEQSETFFEYLNKLNNERKNNNLPTLPILFVFNCKPSNTNKDALKQILDKYEHLKEEGEKYDEKNLPLSQRLHLIGKKDTIIKDNIIELELLEEKKKGSGRTEVIQGDGLSNLLRATKFFIKERNPFYQEDFNKIKNFINEFKNFDLNKKNGKQLTKMQEENLKGLKNKCKDLISKISQENNLLSKLKNEDEIIKKAKNESYNIIYIFSALGFMAGMIPVPYVDIPILYSIYYGMITKIGNCFNVKYSEIENMVYVKLMLGLGDIVQFSAKIIGNGVASTKGESLGKELIYDLGKEQVINWSKNGLHVMKSGANVNVEEVAENLIIKNESKFNSFFTYIYSLFPSFNKSVKNSIEAWGQELGKQLENVLIENTSNLSKDFVSKTSEEVGKKFSEKLVDNSRRHLKTFTPKFIPIIGSLISGTIDSYSTYNVGKNTIKYFEDYIKKNMCCEFIVKRKEEYEKKFLIR